jgi:hypothetical protein
MDATLAILAVITPMRRTVMLNLIVTGVGQRALGAAIMARPVMTKMMKPLALLLGIAIGTRLTAHIHAMRDQSPVTLSPPRRHATIIIIVIGVEHQVMGIATLAILAVITKMRMTATMKGIAIGNPATVHAMMVQQLVRLTPPEQPAMLCMIVIGVARRALENIVMMDILAAITLMRRTVMLKLIVTGKGRRALGAAIMARAVMRKMMKPIALLLGIAIGTRLTAHIHAMRAQTPVTLSPTRRYAIITITVIGIMDATLAILAVITPMRRTVMLNLIVNGTTLSRSAKMISPSSEPCRKYGFGGVEPNSGSARWLKQFC